MSPWIKLALVATVLAVSAGCSQKKEDLKSPCVGAEKSPCDRRPVNMPWLS